VDTFPWGTHPVKKKTQVHARAQRAQLPFKLFICGLTLYKFRALIGANRWRYGDKRERGKRGTVDSHREINLDSPDAVIGPR
jgi:hypothetical protein